MTNMDCFLLGCLAGITATAPLFLYLFRVMAKMAAFNEKMFRDLLQKYYEKRTNDDSDEEDWKL